MSFFELEVAMKAGIPVILSGPPGVGKTKGVEAMFGRYNMAYKLLIASIRDPQDFAGLPIVNHEDQTFRMAAPGWVAELWDAHEKGQKTAVFIDELSTAMPAVQAACLRVVQDRVVGDDPLPPDCYVVAAMNPAEYAANGFDLAAPLANRFMWINVELDPKSFVQEFPVYWGNAPKLKGIDGMKWQQKRGLIASFINSNSSHLLDLPKEESKRGGAWASPRTWDYLSRIMATTDDMMTVSRTAAGLVGEGSAREFLAWNKNVDLPDPKSVLDSWETWQIPTRSDKLFAITANIASYALSHLKDNPNKKEAVDIYFRTWKVLGRLADEKKADIAGIWAPKLLEAKPASCPTIQTELVKFGSLLSKVKV